MPPKNLVELNLPIKEGWETVVTELCEQLYASLPFRIGSVVKSTGARIRSFSYGYFYLV